MLSARVFKPHALVVVIALVVSGCATVRVDPSIYEAERFAIASVHARRSISFDSVRVAPMWHDNELGSDVVEMELGETEVRLGELFGKEVLPVGKALEQSRAYDKLPESWPPEEWSQVNDMIAVDVDNQASLPALGALAVALDVDAVIVLRHEFALARDRFEIGEGVTAYDRCTILVVDREGKRLWEDVAISRVPVSMIFSGAFAVGMQFATWADEARQLSRRSAQQALDILADRYRQSRARFHGATGGAGPAADGARPSGPANDPPPPLDDPSTTPDATP